MKFVKRHRVLTVCLILVLAFWGWRTWDGHFPPERWADTPISQRGKLVDSLLEQYDGLVGMSREEVEALLGGDTPGDVYKRQLWMWRPWSAPPWRASSGSRSEHRGEIALAGEDEILYNLP